MEKIDYQIPTLKDVNSISYGACNPGGSPLGDPACTFGGNAGATCTTGSIAAVDCSSVGNHATGNPGNCSSTGNTANTCTATGGQATTNL